MNEPLPLSALLSQVLVAFTIEFDNEFEHRVPHRTTNHGSTGDPASIPWLVSMTMWLQVMRFVPDEGIDAKTLYHFTGLAPKAFRMWITRLSKWWGYVIVEDSFVRPTAGGLKAVEAWRPLTATIEERWRKRFGKSRMDTLCNTMLSVMKKFDDEYTDYLPVLGYELLSTGPAQASRKARAVRPASSSGATVPTLLAKLLLAFANEFEHASRISLAMSANLLRLAGDKSIPVRNLPELAGISKEGIAMCLRRAEECKLGVVKTEANSRVKKFVLSAKGRTAGKTYTDLTRKIEIGWRRRFGKDLETLRAAVESLVGPPSSENSPLFEGLLPYPDGWRASVGKPIKLPHFPMILHRGGFPDGS